MTGNIRKNRPAVGRWHAAVVEDVPMVLECLNDEDNFQWLEGVDEQTLKQAIDGGSGASNGLLIYRVSDASLAFAYMSHLDTCEAKLEEFAVFAAGRGHGSNALAALCEYLRNKKRFKRMWLHVVTTNERAIHIYRKLGFRDQSIVPGGWTNRLGENVPIYRFWKDLEYVEN